MKRMNNRRIDTGRHVENYVETVSILHRGEWKHPAAAGQPAGAGLVGGEKGMSRQRKTRTPECIWKTAEAMEKRFIPFAGGERRACRRGRAAEVRG